MAASNLRLFCTVLTAVLGCSSSSGGGTTSDTSTSSAATSESTAPSDTTTTLGGADTSSDGDSTSTTGGFVGPLGPWRVMTFNIMCSSCAPEGFEGWEARVPYTGDTMRRHDPDLIGTQELFSGAEVAQIEAELPEHTSIWWAAPNEESLDYADAVIFYRTSMFEEVEHGFYWLSPKPDTAYSTGFSTPQLPRLVVWARLHAIAEDTDFIFATTHFDNNSPSQQLSAPLVLERTAGLASEVPVVMVGDYNSRPDTPAYAILTGTEGDAPHPFVDTFVLAGDDWRQDSNLDPVPEYDPSLRIDHVFVAGASWQASDWVVDQWGYGATEHYTSDHFAISVQIAVP